MHFFQIHRTKDHGPHIQFHSRKVSSQDSLKYLFCRLGSQIIQLLVENVGIWAALNMLFAE